MNLISFRHFSILRTKLARIFFGMSKKNTKHPPTNAQTVEPSTVKIVSNETNTWLDTLTKGYVPYILLSVLSILLYANTFTHQFALDDDIVICRNEHVMQGLGGIKNIFSKDLFDSYYKQMNTTAQLSGGRYRPLSVATFAIEQEFIGSHPIPDSIAMISDSASQRMAYNAWLINYFSNGWDKNHNGKLEADEDLNHDGSANDKDVKAKGLMLRHVNNVLLFALLSCLIYFFLNQVIFKENKWLSLLVALLFAAHPIHTEAIANMKSRDEIMSLTFMLLTLYQAIRYDALGKAKFAFLSALCLLCGLLSKEYSATLYLLVPATIYLFGSGWNITKNILLYILYGVVGIIYYLMRSSSGLIMGKADIQETEIMNSPYLWADKGQEIATKFYVFFKYLWLQIFPHPLVSDYGYNSIPYKNFTDPLALLGIALFIGMIVLAVRFLKQRNWMAFPILFYFLNLLLVTNFVFNVGATMGERLAFHSSLGFCMMLGYGLYYLSKRMNQIPVSAFILIPILVLYSMKTISRNKAWESDVTLALTDVQIQPESIALNGNASSRNFDLSEMPANKDKVNEYARKAIQYGSKAIQLHKEFVNGHVNLGLAYIKVGQLDSARWCFDNAFRIYPHYPRREDYMKFLGSKYYDIGFALGNKKQWNEGKFWIQKAVGCDSMNYSYWYDLGGFSYNGQDFNLAKQAWTRAYQLNPNDPNVQRVQGLIR